MKLQVLVRKLHRTLAPIVILPLLVTVTTGVTYRLLKDWVGLTRDQVHFLMAISRRRIFGANPGTVLCIVERPGATVDADDGGE